MQIDYKGGCYRASGEHAPDLMRKAGWMWLPGFGEWRTSHIMRVIPFAAFCVGEAAKRVVPLIEQRRAAIAASTAATADIIVPVGAKAAAAGKDFRSYQKAAIKFIAPKHKALDADVPRLGKMITGIGVANYQPAGSLARVLALCPANAKITWCERWEEWGTHQLAAGYCDGSHNPQTPFLAVNWEILDRHIAYIMATPWDIVIGDELHRCGSFDSKRTRLTFGPDGLGGIPARKHWLGLSGNPLGTRPLNLWPICRFMDPHGLGQSKWNFRKRYCGASAENGWDSLGASNEEELQFKLRSTFMVRREQYEVGDELPPNRCTIKLPKEGLSRLIKAERTAVQQNLEEFETLVRSSSKAAAARAEELARDIDLDEEPTPDSAGMAVQALTLAALPMMIEFIREQRETEKKVIVFCHHRAVAKALHEAFPGCAFLIGGLSAKQREAERRRFQEDAGCHEFIGNVSACCENIELSAADVVIFCELVWQTWQLDQAEMRPWLPGKTTPIQIFRLVVEGSASADMADLLELRQDSIERATVAKRMAM